MQARWADARGTEEVTASGVAHAVVFRAGAGLCAVLASSVHEVMRPLPVQPLSSPLACVLGAALIRGAAVPVVDVHALLTGEAGTAIERYVVVRAATRRVALATGVVLGVLPLTALTLTEAPPLLSHAAADTMDALGRLDDELVTVLRAARLLPAAGLEGEPVQPA